MAIKEKATGFWNSSNKFWVVMTCISTAMFILQVCYPVFRMPFDYFKNSQQKIEYVQKQLDDKFGESSADRKDIRKTQENGFRQNAVDHNEIKSMMSDTDKKLNQIATTTNHTAGQVDALLKIVTNPHASNSPNTIPKTTHQN